MTEKELSEFVKKLKISVKRYYCNNVLGYYLDNDDDSQLLNDETNEIYLSLIINDFKKTTNQKDIPEFLYEEESNVKAMNDVLRKHQKLSRSFKKKDSQSQTQTTSNV